VFGDPKDNLVWIRDAIDKFMSHHAHVFTNPKINCTQKTGMIEGM